MEQLYIRPLLPSRRAIRLLEILFNNGHVEYRLHLATIGDDLRFEALSYVWGDPNDTTDIIVNGIKTAVTRNLAAALGQVLNFWRYEYPFRSLASLRLWVDALCINQADPVERREQVKLMPDVYSSAKLVIAWLGHEDPVSLWIGADTLWTLYNAFNEVVRDTDEMCKMNWIRKYPGLITAPDCNVRWKSVRHLLNLPYWTRVWVLQENTLASELLYLLPYAILGQSTLMALCSMFELLAVELHRRKIPRPKFIPDSVWLYFNPPKYIKFIQWGSISRLCMARQSYHGSREPDPLLSQIGGILHATDPKDHIYGLRK
jgi:hypothetical protein